uniref:Uncharacterized protein n=1 Tax=Anopheles darlingi TaxID=43151 RepID=A0A2M4CVJ1_ANODA
MVSRRRNFSFIKPIFCTSLCPLVHRARCSEGRLETSRGSGETKGHLFFGDCCCCRLHINNRAQITYPSANVSEEIFISVSVSHRSPALARSLSLSRLGSCISLLLMLRHATDAALQYSLSHCLSYRSASVSGFATWEHVCVCMRFSIFSLSLSISLSLSLCLSLCSVSSRPYSVCFATVWLSCV